MTGRGENLVVVQGRQRIVEFAAFAGGHPAQEFLDLSVEPKTKSHLLAVLRHMADEGERALSPQMFCHERDEIYTFKTKENKRRIRFPCFRIENRWIITHGFVKPGGESKWREQEFTRAHQIRAAVLEFEQRKKKHHP